MISQEVGGLITAYNLAQIPQHVICECVRDQLLLDCHPEHHETTYFAQMQRIVPGERHATDLGAYLTELAKQFEAARRRSAKTLLRVAEISAFPLTY